MKIAILTSGILPIPAVQGGAVENLIDFYLEYNDRHRLHDITVYSVRHPNVYRHPALHSSVNHYVHIDTRSLLARLSAKIYSLFHRDECYYYQIEYFFEQAYKRLRKQSFDLIVLENRPGYALKLSKRLTTPIVSHMHTNQLFEPTPQNKAIIRSTTRFLTVSAYLKREIESVGLPADISIVYNGLDADLFRRSQVTPVSRASLGFSPDDFVAVFCGRLVPDKGIKELLQAFLLLKDQPKAKLMVLGSSEFANSSQSNDFIRELRQMAGQLSGRIAFTGFVPYTQIPSYLAVADVSVVPSHINEAFGMTCIEACAMGLPVIATNDGGIPETLIGQKHILVDKSYRLPQQLADALLHVKEHLPKYQGNTLPQSFTKTAYAETFFGQLSIPTESS